MTINNSRITIINILNESKNHIEEFFITYFDIPENNIEYSSTKYYTKSEEIDDLVNPFLKTVDVKDEDKITVEQGEGYVRVSIIYKVKIDKV
jgi:hypothetical protein